MIFCGRTHHGGPTNINVLDRLIPGDISLGHRFPEGIQIHNHHINQLDVLLFKIVLMGRITTLGQNSTVNTGMQRFDAATQNLRGAGVLGNTGNRKASLLKHLGGATTGEQLIAMDSMQSLGQRQKPRFVGHTQQSDRSHQAT